MATNLTPKDFNRICRTCLIIEDSVVNNGNSKNLQPISDSMANDLQTPIEEILNTIMPQLFITDIYNDKLPKNVCVSCIEKLSQCHSFYEMCVKSDFQLRALLRQQKIQETTKKYCNKYPSRKNSDEDPLYEDNYVDENDDLEKSSARLVKIEIEDLEIKVAEEEQKSDIGSVDDKEQEKHIEEITINNTNIQFESIESVHHKVHENNAELATEMQQTDATIEDLESNCDNEEKNCIYTTEILMDESPVSKSKTTQISYKCDICGGKFGRLYHLNRHKMNVHSATVSPSAKKIYNCDHCDSKFSTMKNLRRHIRNLHPEKHKNELEKTLEDKKKNDSKHSNTADNPISHLCDICSRTFKTETMLKKHQRNYHGSVLKPDGLDSKDVNDDNDESKRRYKCAYCTKSFLQVCTLKEHIRIHTGEQPFLCSECGKSFKSSSNMKQHLLRHTGEKRYSCDKCPKKFPCLSDLASHKAVHVNFKPHVCSLCGAAFGKPYQLKKHNMYHSGEKPYQCEYCDKRFVLADHMRRHRRTHTGEKPYKCEYCTRAFAQSNDLIKHLRFHLGNCVYKCELCPRRFRLATELRIHFADHKNDDDETRQKHQKEWAIEEERLKKIIGPKQQQQQQPEQQQ